MRRLSTLTLPRALSIKSRTLSTKPSFVTMGEAMLRLAPIVGSPPSPPSLAICHNHFYARLAATN